MNWKDIPNYSKYEISEDGQFATKAKTFKNGKKRPRKIWPNSIDVGGYFRVDIYNDQGMRKKVRVHKLVANAFIPKVEGKEYINHINGNKQDNHVENLEWVTLSENMRHAYDTGLKKNTEKQRKSASIIGKTKRIKVLATFDNGSTKMFESQKQCSKYLGVSQQLLITKLNSNTSINNVKLERMR